MTFLSFFEKGQNFLIKRNLSSFIIFSSIFFSSISIYTIHEKNPQLIPMEIELIDSLEALHICNSTWIHFFFLGKWQVKDFIYKKALQYSIKKKRNRSNVWLPTLASSPCQFIGIICMPCHWSICYLYFGPSWILTLSTIVCPCSLSLEC